MRRVPLLLSLLLIGPTFLCPADDGLWDGSVMIDVKRRTSEKTWKPRETHLVRHLKGFDQGATPPSLSKFGGRMDRQVDATGFFRVEKTNAGFSMIDPDGHPFIAAGLCSVKPLPSPVPQAAFKKKFGSQEAWATATAKMLREAGFNCLGNWADWPTFSAHCPMPYAASLSFMGSYGRERGGVHQQSGHLGYLNDAIFVFDPGFEEFCDRRAQERVAPIKDDPWLVGYFSDNELPFPAKALDGYLRLSKDEPGYRAAAKWLAEKRGSDDRSSITDAEYAEFLEVVVDRYFRITRDAIRRYDSNHLFLGSRIHGGNIRRDPVIRGCGSYLDVVSINLYGVWTQEVARMDRWTRLSGKPFIITEWYAKGMDSGMGNTTGAGWTVKTQADRGAFYQNFTLGLLSRADCVGWHLFKYQDNDPGNTRADPSNLDSNKGIVTGTFEPYTDYLVAIRELNRRVYAISDFFASR